MFKASKAKIQSKKNKVKESSRPEIPSETTLTAENAQNEESSEHASSTNIQPKEGGGENVEKTSKNEIKLEGKTFKEETPADDNEKSKAELKDEAPVENAEDNKSEAELQDDAKLESFVEKKPKVVLKEKASDRDDEVASTKTVTASPAKTVSGKSKTLGKEKPETAMDGNNSSSKPMSKTVEILQPVSPAETSPTADPSRRKSSQGDASINQYGVVEAAVSTPPNDDADDQVPVAWEKRISRTTGKPYYLNMYTKESQWERPTSPAQPPPVPMETIICRHILIKHKDSRRPFSWKSPNTKITRTKEEAIQMLSHYRQDITKGEIYFADVARAYSDCTSADVGGDLGKFTRGVMLKAFEDAAFKLKVRQMSDIIETESGVHLIMRLA